MENKIAETADFIRASVNVHQNATGIILGTGLGNIVSKITDAQSLAYGNIPNFPVSTVAGHSGRLIFGFLGETPVIALQGRFHSYEGYTMKELTFPVRVLFALGVRKMVVSNAAGGLNPDFNIGDMMIINDHINMFSDNPLIGKNDDLLGPRFPDMSSAYDEEAIFLAKEKAATLGLNVRTGVYTAVSGPCFETPSECRFLRRIGADAVGMSTIPEVITARHSGMKVFAFSVITDLAYEGAEASVSHEEVLKAAAAAEPAISRVVEALVRAW